jgi:kanamycin nucleotidyltransferase
MNHKQRVDAAQEVCSKLLKSNPDEILAVGVLGSVARGEDKEHSDVDMQVLVKTGANIESHYFVLNGCYFSVGVKTEKQWVDELTKPLSGLCLTAGAFRNVLVLHDPTGAFKKLRAIAEELPDEAWKDAIREGLAGIVEDLGRVRNLYNEGDRAGFKLFSVLVAIGMAKVYGDLTRQVLNTEKEFNLVFERRGGPMKDAAKAYRVSVGIDDATDKEVMNALEWLRDFLYKEAELEDALPVTYKSAGSYEPP